MSVRVRFAPSPTGHVHIGNIRAAIFNWLFARHAGGAFLLRIEDTDLERSTPAAIASLLDVMDWLKLDYDGEPLYQSREAGHHVDVARGLERAGRVYPFSKTPGEPPALYFRIPLDADDVPGVRAAGPARIDTHPAAPVQIDATGVRFSVFSKKGEPVAEEVCLAGVKGLRLTDTAGHAVFELDPNLDDIVSGAKRFAFERIARMEFDRREIVFRDLVKGELAKPLDGMKDLILVRANGAPVFHLANVCDDVTMRITHIVRGDDHVENTFRHLCLYHAMGATPPEYAHLPMIVNAQGKPYSKRDGDAYVGDFRARGFDPDALFNYLSLLGWSPGDDREKMTRAELVERFTLDRVRGSPAQMDLRKLTDLNGQYIAALPAEDFLRRARATARAWDWGRTADEALFARVCALMQSRTKLYPEIERWGYLFADQFAYDEQAVKKNLRKEGARAALQTVRERVAGAPFELAALEAGIRAAEAAAGVPEGKLNQPVRVAVTGTAIGAGLYETMVLLGRERCLRRLDHAIANLCGS